MGDEIEDGDGEKGMKRGDGGGRVEGEGGHIWGRGKGNEGEGVGVGPNHVGLFCIIFMLI